MWVIEGLVRRLSKAASDAETDVELSNKAAEAVFRVALLVLETAVADQL